MLKLFYCMSLNFSQFYSYPILILSILVAISRSSKITVWLILEINILIFISILSGAVEEFFFSQVIKYFIIQSIGSAFMVLIIISLFSSYLFISLEILFFFTIILKLGIPPFHPWYINIFFRLDWTNLFTLSTVQKIIPLYLLTFSINSHFIVIIICLTCIICSAAAVFTYTTKLILGYSSLFNICWIVRAIQEFIIRIFFLLIYRVNLLIVIAYLHFLNLSSVNFIKIRNPREFHNYFLLGSALRLGGIPPFIGFYSKILIIVFLINTQQLTILFIILLSSIFILYIYIRIITFLIIQLNFVFIIPAKFYTYYLELRLLLISFFPLIFIL